MSALPAPLKIALPLAAPLALVPQAATYALSFNFDYDSAVPEALQLAAEEAAGRWSNSLKDDVTVNVRLEFADLSAAGNVLGGVRPGKVTFKYEDYADALFRDAISNNDLLGLDSLPLSSKGRQVVQNFRTGELSFEKARKANLESKEFAFLMDGQFAKGNGSNADFVDNNGNNNNKKVQLTRAQAKALNLRNPHERALDALITINRNVDWDFDGSDRIAGNRYDPVTVIKHEIGHALGAVSGVDTLDFLASTGSQPIDDGSDIEKNKFSYLTPMDFYRYSNKSADLGVADLTIGGSEKYFSLDGGKSAVTDELGRTAYFSTGSLDSQGDGYQGSHWKNSSDPFGVMNPTLEPGQSIDISQLDLTLLDTVGWDLQDSYVERAAAVGIDWNALKSQLASDRQLVISELSNKWSDDIPALDAAIEEFSADIELKFQQKLQEKFDELTKKAKDDEKQKKLAKEREKFYESVGKEAEKRNKELRKLPEDIYEIDEEVREWLDLPVDELSEEMQEANSAEINRLANIVKALPTEERTAVESKLEVSVAAFADKPNKLVKELLDSSGPANPIGRSYFRW